MAFFFCDRTCCLSVLLGPMAHFAVPCVVFLPDMHLPEYISHEADLGRREKAQGLFDALSHPLFKLTAAFFCDVFAVVCATSKKVQATRGARVAAVQGLMNVMCTQLLHTMRHVIPRGVGGIVGC